MSIRSQPHIDRRNWQNRAKRRKNYPGLRSGDRVDWHAPIYKHVSSDHALTVADGGLRISNLDEFASLEDERRRDEHENTIIRDFDGLDSAIPSHARFIQDSGLFDVQNGTRLQFENIQVATKGANHYCCCFSKRAEDFDEFEGAVFEIPDPTALAIQLRRANSCLGNFWVSPVTYRDIEISHSDPYVNFSPVVKSAKFASENEIRILWRRRNAACPWVIISTKTLNLKNLIRRIR